MSDPQSVADRLSTRENGLNAVRLVLAAAVLVAHAALFFEHPRELTVLGVGISAWAVYGFFAISGYLVSVSVVRSSSVRRYLRKRVLRIYPAFWVCLAVTAAVIAPVVTTTWSRNTYRATDGLDYVVSNATLHIQRCDIGSSLAGAPVECWNPSLWTLEYEFVCYVLLIPIAAVAAAWVPRRFGTWWWGGVWLASVAVHLALPKVVTLTGGSFTAQATKLIPIFLAGSLVAQVAHRIPSRWWLALICLGVTGVGVMYEPRTAFQVLGPLYAVALLIVGGELRVPQWAQVHDLSYGT